MRNSAIPISLVVLLFVACQAGTSQVSAERYSIEDIMSAAFPTDLTAGPGSNTVAWVENSEGRRNIWFASGPDYRSRQLTGYAEDNGFAIGNLVFSPDGEYIYYEYGGSANSQGEFPNPVSLPEGGIQEIRKIPVTENTGMESEKIAEGYAPLISPDGVRSMVLRQAPALQDRRARRRK